MPRLEKWANQISPLKLAGSKSVVQSILSVCLIATLLASVTFLGDYSVASTETTTLSGGLSRVLASAQAGGREIIDFVDAFQRNIASGDLTPVALGKIAGATVWSGVVGTAYVLYAQSYGQRYVRPSEANLVYSLQPIFTALFAYAILGETMETAGYLGGGLILSAVYLVASKSISSTKDTKEGGETL